MKSLKLLITAVMGCMSVVFISGSAHAQLQGIIDDYCAEVAQGVGETIGELDEAAADLVDCYDEFDDCMSGLLGSNPVECIAGFGQCIDRAANDLSRACSEFVTEFRGDTRRAGISADSQGVGAEFLDWLSSDSPERNECLAPALATAQVCAGQEVDLPEPASWLMLVTGVGLLSVLHRRRIRTARVH